MRDRHLEVFLEGLQVDYFSNSFKCWAPAVIERVDQETGKVTINARGAPLSREEASKMLRPRTRPGKDHLTWVAQVLRDGLVESEARKVFHRYATQVGPAQCAVLAEKDLCAVGKHIDGLLGVCGSACELQRRATRAGLSQEALPAGWERRRSSQGHVYYCDARGKTQWHFPKMVVQLDASAFVAAFWEMLANANRKWGKVFMLKESSVREISEMYKDYDFGKRPACLGQGTYGDVFLAVHKKTGIKRAVKKVKHCRDRDAALDRLDSEIGRLRALDHPHIVRLYDIYRKDSTLYLAMDYCSGGDLMRHVRDLAARGLRLAEPVLAGLTRQLLMAVAHVHAHGLLHLDIKPNNVVVVPETRTMAPCQGPDPERAGEGAPDPARPLHVMLIDLGLAAAFRPGDFRGGKGLGTPLTMAPEAWRSVETPAADVFSTGCTLFFLLTGGRWPFASPPTKRKEAQAFWDKRPARAAYQPAGAYSPAAYALCDRMLPLDRLQRLTAAQCLQEEFLLGASRAGPEVGERLQRLAKAQGRSLLYMSVALAVASEWPAHRMPSIRKAFEELDVSRTGRLQKSQIARTLISLGHDADISYKAADAMDLSRDGMVDWTEFVAACVQLGSSSLENDLREVFNEADADGDGFLDREDVAKLLPIESLRGELVDSTMQELVGPSGPRGPGVRVDWPTFRRHFSSISVDRGPTEN